MQMPSSGAGGAELLDQARAYGAPDAPVIPKKTRILASPYGFFELARNAPTLFRLSWPSRSNWGMTLFPNWLGSAT